MQDNENAVVVYPCSRLSGEIKLQGSKNSVLPIMAAALLKAGVTVLENCPDIADVHAMSGLLKKCGCRVEYNEHVMRIDAYATARRVCNREKTYRFPCVGYAAAWCRHKWEFRRG